MVFRDHFSRQAALYSIYRPSYPPELFEYLASVAPSRRRAWDCATGSGQAAIELAEFFNEVIATDASAEQIAHAEPNDKIRYSVAAADASGIEPRSVDLVTVAQALHWFDVNEFYQEARRVMKADGVIAAWGYGDPVMDDPAIEHVVHQFNRGTIEKYWPPNRDLLLDQYNSVAFPFPPLAPPEFRLEKRWTLGELAGYFRTWSATNRFIAERGFDPVTEVEKKLSTIWGGADRARLVTWPLYLRVGVNSG